METNQIFSSTFASPQAVCVLLVLALVSNYFAMQELAAFLLFVALLSLMAWQWSRTAMKHVRLEISSRNARVFPGSSIPVLFKVENHKLLPLIWLDVLLRAPENGCVEPSGKFQREPYRDFSKGEEYEVFRRKFTWILWHQTLEWKTEFEARRRGIYFLEKVTTCSGDGFGLSVRNREYNLPNPSSFVVFPKLVEADCSPFVRNMYQASVGSSGFYEDQTLLRSNREYQTGDSMRRINWRLAARQDKLQVNVYETILPRSSLFIVDLQSFRKVVQEEPSKREIITVWEEELEETLSIVGSLFVGLEQREMCCGLALPGVSGRMGRILPPEKGAEQTPELLTALAAVEYRGEPCLFAEEELMNLRETCGQAYLVTRSLASCGCKRLLERWGSRLELLVWQEESAGEYRQRLLPSLRKGGVA
ncbi:MAG: DUF58 domain-containing protein [Eubacteriales bacterium]|jgi:uncharacterized protein (DUF58 family)